MKRKIKISCCLICFACVFVSCRSNINKLDQHKVDFEELPLPVRDTLIVLARENKSPWFVFFEKDRYDTKSLDWKRGPFTNGYLLIDNQKGTKYKIDQGIPSPYIIYNNFLYRPVEFNVLFEHRIRNEMFIQYTLK